MGNVGPSFALLRGGPCFVEQTGWDLVGNISQMYGI